MQKLGCEFHCPNDHVMHSVAVIKGVTCNVRRHWRTLKCDATDVMTIGAAVTGASLAFIAEYGLILMVTVREWQWK